MSLTKDALKVNEKFKPSGKCILWLLSLLFIVIVTAFGFMQVLEITRSIGSLAKDAEDEVDAKVVQIIMNDKTQVVNEGAVQQLLLVNVEQQNDTEKRMDTTIQQQQQQQLQHQNKRDVSANEDNQNDTTIHQGYYEEQRPVVVRSETQPTLGRRQDYFGAPTTNFQYPYYERPAAAEYEEQEQEQEDAVDGGEMGVNRYPYEQRQPAGYYDDDEGDDGDDVESAGGEDAGVGEGRAAQDTGYDAYYRQWHYATPAPVASQRPNGNWEVGGNRKLQNGERDPYAAYDTDGPLADYEYPGAPTPLQKQQYQQQQQLQHQHQQPQNRPQQTTTQHQQAVQEAGLQHRPSATAAPTENTLISTLKSLKTMWDIYQAFAAAWNVLATNRQKQQKQQDEAIKRREQQIAQQMRINSKKPPKFEANDRYTQRNGSASAVNGGADVAGTTNGGKRVRLNNKSTKRPKTATTKSTTTKSTSTTELAMSSEMEETIANSSNSSRGDGGKGGIGNKIVGTKSVAAARQIAEGKREKRQMSDTADATKSTDVGEGRYIKGDPLKGYYDFVITEGSYKFWAVFQTGTALLIIYSTFAAIYYSKVNPLVSDYDYVDYLGGARSLRGVGDDDDFIDDDSDSNGTTTGGNGKQRRYSWFDGMLPRAGRTMKYILDALDKLPVDHREADETMQGERLRLAAGTAEPERQTTADDVSVGVANGSDETTTADEADANEERSKEEDVAATMQQVRAYAA